MTVKPDPEITRRYKGGETMREIAADLGRSYGYVRSRLKAAGVQMRHCGGGWPQGCRRRWVELAPCGTIGAAQRHRRRGEPIDEACRAAEREYHRAYGKRRRGVAADAGGNR